MVVHFFKLVWYEKLSDGTLATGVDITDAVSWDVKKGIKSKAASFDINLKNNWKSHIATAGDRINEMAIQADDEIKVYADNAPITEDASQLLMVGTVMAFEGLASGKKRTIKVKCSDKSQLILNKIAPKGNYASGSGWTASSIIIDVVKQISQNAGSFDIDTSNVATTRSDSSAFPAIDVGKSMKPVHEWINELSNPERTNSAAELAPGGTLVDTKTYIWYLDENNKLFWFYPDDSVQYTLVYGVDRVFQVKLKKDVFDVINMVIIRGGKDKRGSGITWYYYDRATKQKELRFKVLPRPRLAELEREVLIQEDDTQTTLDGAITNDATTISLTDASSFPASGHVRIGEEYIAYSGKSSNDLTGCTRAAFATAAVQHEDDVLVKDASTYGAMSNDDFRDRVKNLIESEGQKITTKYGDPRWRGSIEVEGAKYTAGELLNITCEDIGVSNQILRIIDVHHQMTKKGWFTTLKVEEDEKNLGS